MDKGVARVTFTYQGQEVEWKLRVDNDWLDENVLALYDRLLQPNKFRLYVNRRDFGQCALSAVFSEDQFRAFDKLSQHKMQWFL